MTESRNTYSTRMLGVVTLYNPKFKDVVDNIKRYLSDLDTLIIWDNSPLEKNLKSIITALLGNEAEKVIWHGDGKNHFIAQAINYAWHYAAEHSFDLLLIMDQDSQWENFSTYRQKIDTMMTSGELYVYKPYVIGDDELEITGPIVFRRRFINSGTVFPVDILDKLGGADETFALDALDTDMSIRTIQSHFKIACLTDCHLHHVIGQPKMSRIFRISTKDYGRFRTYSITRSHIICYRKNKEWMNDEEKMIFFKEIIIWKLIRIVLVESDKLGRMKMYLKGIKDGLLYKFVK